MKRIEKLASGAISEEFQITFILANGVQLKANKLLVCQESSYVKSLLLRWDKSGQVDLTNLHFITEDSMNIFLEFVKSKKLPELDNEVCITEVFATANYLGAPNLLEKLEDRVQGISIEYVLGIQYFEKVLVLDIQYILRRSIGKSINTFRLEIQYPILFSRIFQSFQSKNSKFSLKI